MTLRVVSGTLPRSRPSGISITNGAGSIEIAPREVEVSPSTFPTEVFPHPSPAARPLLFSTGTNSSMPSCLTCLNPGVSQVFTFISTPRVLLPVLTPVPTSPSMDLLPQPLTEVVARISVVTSSTFRSTMVRAFSGDDDFAYASILHDGGHRAERR